MKTAIVTDTNSGIYEAEGRELGVFVVPMPIIAGDETYYEGLTITRERFFELLQSDMTVRTSQPAPGDVAALWDRVLEEYDELVYIPMSGGLSSSVRSAELLAEEYDGRVQVADNHRISVTMRHAVLDAIALAERGMSAAEIKKVLEKSAYDSTVFLGVESLHYLKRGGRISPAAATIGSILNIKPLLVIRGEKIEPFATVRGTKNCRKRELEEMYKTAQEYKARGEHIRIGLAGSFVREEDAEPWKQMAAEVFPGEEIRYDPLSYSVCCHTGPDAFGIGVSVRCE